jgi:stearoyl-CoA desaturase (delta-9 desaturase)
MVWLSKYNYVPLVVLSVLLLTFGGLPFLLWGVFFRVTMGLHATWMVNSLTHFWGGRRFATGDSSRNNVLVALLTFGEGWHNNHHAHPTSARHGLAWYEIDMTWMTIWLLKMLGLARSVRVAGIQTAQALPRA